MARPGRHSRPANTLLVREDLRGRLEAPLCRRAYFRRADTRRTVYDETEPAPQGCTSSRRAGTTLKSVSRAVCPLADFNCYARHERAGIQISAYQVDRVRALVGQDRP